MSLSNDMLTEKNHASHLPLLLKTWLPVAGSSVHIFTDSKPSKDLGDEISSIGAQIVNTGCRSDHSVEGLSCKMQEELTTFLHSYSKETRCWAGAPCWRGQPCPNVSTELASSTGAPVQHQEETWFCHVDDDNYLHTGNLLKMLSRHPTTRGEQFYLGKKSRPFWEIFDGRLGYKIS